MDKRFRYLIQQLQDELLRMEGDKAQADGVNGDSYRILIHEIAGFAKATEMVKDFATLFDDAARR